METRLLVAYALIVLVALTLAFAYLMLTRERRGERRLERLAERNRRARRDERRRSEAALDG